MRHLWLLSHLTLLICFVVSCNDQKIVTAWTDSPIVADGDTSDWPDSAITFFPDEELSVGAANDGDHLYLLLRFRNIAWARAIRMTGVSVWVNPEGKKDREIGIRYFGGPKLPERPQREGVQPAILPRPAMHEKQFLFIEKQRLAEVTIPVDGSMGPAIGFDTTGGMYTYELSIPWQASMAGRYGIELSPGQEYAIGAEWGNMDELREPMRGSGPPGDGIGRRPGGGTDRPGGRRPQIEEKEYWVKSVTAGPATKE